MLHFKFEAEARIVDALKSERYSAVLWVQGESDALEGLSAEESYENLKSVINASRQIQPNIPWYVSLNGYAYCGPYPQGPARLAQLRIIKEGLARAGPDLDLLRKNPGFFEESGAELQSLGFQEYAKEWLQILEKDMK